MRRLLPTALDLAPTRRWRLAAGLAGLWLVFASTALAAPQALDLAALDRAPDLSLPAEIVTGADRALPPEAVVSGAAPLAFNRPAAAVPQVKSPDGDVWIRFRLTNSAPAPRSGMFVISFPYLEQVDLFEPLPGGLLARSTAGAAAPISGAAVATGYPTFQLLLGPGETRDYYVRVRSDTVLFFPMRIVSASHFSHAITRDALIWSLIAGTALAFALYAVSMSFGQTRSAYRAYFCFSLSAAAYILISSGPMRAIFGGAAGLDLNALVYAAQALLIAFGTLFIIRFLDLLRAAPRINGVFLVLAGVAALTGLSALLPVWLARLAYLVATGLGPLILMAGLGWLTFRRLPGARNLLAAWTPCFLATVWIYLRLFNITPYLPINHFVVPLSFAFTLAHLSAILGGRARQAELWANNDMLTGLGNRRLLTSVLELEAREPSRRYGAAIAIDLDDFKPVNDRHGHAAGDAVLAAVGERLRAVFKGKGDVFRLGGDEFVVLCYQSLSRMEIIQLAGDYLQENRQPVAFENVTLRIDASVGVAFRADHGDLAAMLKQADVELYAVKQAGRGMVRIADQRVSERRRPHRPFKLLPSAGIFFARTNDHGRIAANDTHGSDERARR